MGKPQRKGKYTSIHPMIELSGDVGIFGVPFRTIVRQDVSDGSYSECVTFVVVVYIGRIKSKNKQQTIFYIVGPSR